MNHEPPEIPGVRRSFVPARGVRFHVTESGPVDGRPVLCLHGWPEHHWVYRDLLADPPEGLRIIVPDLPGYGWSGPAPHKWAKEDVVSDLVALMDQMGLDKVLLVGHDWGGYLGYLLALRVPQRISGYLALNITHVWNTTRTMLPHIGRFLLYQPFVASIGVPLHRHTPYVRALFAFAAPKLDRQVARVFADGFRNPVSAKAARDTYRTFLLKEMPRWARHPESRRATVPIRVLFGTKDIAIHPSLTAPETANADDFTVELVDAGHFILDERPDLVRAALIKLAAEV